MRTFVLILLSTLPFLASVTISPALPGITEAFQTEAHVQWLVRLVLTLPGLFIVIGAPLAGRIIDRFGRRRLLISSLILYGVTSTAGFYLDSLWWLLSSRALLGLAVAGVMITTTTLVADYYQGEARSRLLGLQGVFVGFSSVVFVFLSGVLADLSWRTPFLIYLLAFLVLPLVVYAIREPARKMGKPTSTGTLPQALTAFIYPIAFLIMTVFYVLVVNLPFYIRDLGSQSSTLAGSALALITLSAALISFLFKWLKQQFSYRIMFMAIFGIACIGYVILLFATMPAWVVAGLIATGLGMGLVMPTLNLLLLSKSAEESRGKAVAGMTTAVFMGQFFSTLLAGPLASWIGIRITFGVGSVILLLMSLSFLTQRAKAFVG